MNKIDPKVIKITSIALGIIISIGVIILGFKILMGAFSRAAQDTATNVATENITENSATITWEAAEGTRGVVTYGTTSTALNFFAPESGSGSGIKHSVDITLLTPNTTYYFIVKIGTNSTDQGGFPFQFKTKASGESAAPTIIVPTRKTQSVVVPAKKNAPTLAPIGSCSETDCDQIRLKLGKGCTTQDYFACLRRNQTGEPTTAPISAP